MAFSEAFLEWERQTQERSKQEATQSIALKMLQMSLPLETVSEATGLSIEQLQQLQSNRSQ